MLISHAQNFEDVILWRALKHVENGFYIDVGAQDPEIDSVSLLFHERGWRGVHVEPTAEYSEKLRVARPDEETIQAAISSQAGPIAFFEIKGTGLSTGDPLIAERHRAKGWNEVETKVPTMRLGEVLDRYGDRDIHWLKIDVEGMEQEVIETWSPSLSRPWIVMVESTEPTSDEPTHAAWQGHLEGLGYRFVYFDGLNRFYVSEDHLDLAGAFGPGPNIFDDFALSGRGSAPFAEVLKAEIAGARGEIDRLQEALDTAAAESAGRKAETQRVLADTFQRLSVQERLLTEAQETSSLQVAAFHKASFAMERVAEVLTVEIADKARRIAELEATLPASATGKSTRRASRLSWFIQGSAAWLRMKPGSRPRRVAGRALRSGVLYLRDRPRAKRAMVRLTGFVPPLQKRLLRYAGAVPDREAPYLPRTGEGQWFLEPEPAMVAKWAKLLASNKLGR